MRQGTQKVGLLPIEGFPLLSYASVVEPLRFANLLSGQNLYDLLVVAKSAGSVASAGPALVTASFELVSERRFDYLFVIAGGRPEGFEDRTTLNWIAKIARDTGKVCGVSGGPVLLAKAGILAGHRATVHWEHAPALVEAYPNLLLERSLFTIDRNILTCGGGAAALDMTLAMIESDHGAELMRRVSDWCLYGDLRKSSNSQRRPVVKIVGRGAAAVHKAVAYMEDNISTLATLSEIAEEAGLSGRQLNRIFKNTTGDTVMAYYRKARLRVASNLLSSSALSVTEIAIATGFSSSSHFAAAYQAHFGALPSHSR